MTLTVPCSTASSNTSSSRLLAGIGHAPLYVPQEFQQVGPRDLCDGLVPERSRDVILKRIDPVRRAFRVPLRLDEFLVIGTGKANEGRLLLLLFGLALALGLSSCRSSLVALVYWIERRVGSE